MAAPTFIAGPYTATWNSADIGGTREGFRIREVHHNEPITMDAYGDIGVNAVVRGWDCFVELDYVEYGKLKTSLAMCGDGAFGIPTGSVGKLATTLAKSLVLTPIIASVGCLTYTFPLALVDGEFLTLLAARLRQGPLTFRCYPDLASDGKYYATSGS